MAGVRDPYYYQIPVRCWASICNRISNNRRPVISLGHLINSCLIDHLRCIVSISNILAYDFPLTVTQLIRNTEKVINVVISYNIERSPNVLEFLSQ